MRLGSSISLVVLFLLDVCVSTRNASTPWLTALRLYRDQDRYFLRVNAERVLTVHARALRNCPWSLALWQVSFATRMSPLLVRCESRLLGLCAFYYSTSVNKNVTLIRSQRAATACALHLSLSSPVFGFWFLFCLQERMIAMETVKHPYDTIKAAFEEALAAGFSSAGTC